MNTGSVSSWNKYIYGYYRREGQYLRFTQEGIALRLPEQFTYNLKDSSITKTSEGYSGKVAVVGWETNVIISEEGKMSKFKVGQKVYSINLGLGEVYNLIDKDCFPVRFESFDSRELASYLTDGRRFLKDVNPTLLTLEEARAKGYDVPKQKIVKEKTVYINLYEDYVFGKFSPEAAKVDCGSGAILRAYPVTIKYEVEE